MLKKIYHIKVLEIFMLIQPILDMVTSIMINEFDLSISLGMIVRFIFIIYASIYLLKLKDKRCLLYLFLWVLYAAISLIGNYLLNDNFAVFKHISLLLKVVYFPITLLFFIMYIKNNKEIDKKIFINIALITGLSLIISSLTNTSYCTYENYDNCQKKGLVAWFNSANEYGLILIALLGFCLISFIKDKKIKSNIAFFLIIIFLCVLGTKASFVGLVGLLSSYVIYYVIICFIDKKRRKDYKRPLIVFITLIAVLASVTKLPIYTNIKSNYERAYENAKSEFDNDEDIKKDVEQNMLFNGREDFTKENKKMFNSGNIFNKLFGIVAQDKDHINERDFHDLFIYYGIIGFILDLFLPLLLFLNIVEKLFKKIKILLCDEVVIYGIVVGLILLGSFVAGHCLFQPAVSIYLAYLLALLNKKVGDSL